MSGKAVDVPVPLEDDDSDVDIPSEDDSNDDELQMDFSFDFKGKGLNSAMKQRKAQKEEFRKINVLEKVLEENGGIDLHDERPSVFSKKQDLDDSDQSDQEDQSSDDGESEDNDNPDEEEKREEQDGEEMDNGGEDTELPQDKIAPVNPSKKNRNREEEEENDDELVENYDKEYFKEIAPSVDTKSSFTSMNLSRPLLKAVNEMGYEHPTPIQARSIPILLQ